MFKRLRPAKRRRIAVVTVTLILFLASAATIYLACEFFVNGVEWVGQGLRLSQSATGSVLAAFGTALPESVVTLVAVVFGTDAAERSIGVGAAMGGPLVLATIAYAVVGLVLVRRGGSTPRRQRRVDADCRRLSRDQLGFLAIFIFTLGCGLVDFPGKAWGALLFVCAYGAYIAKELAHNDGGDGKLEPLRLRPKDTAPSLIWSAAQTLAALAVIFAASRLFVDQIATIGGRLGLPPQLAALLLSPVATEMPEIMNAVVWVRQGKERLALANISGAMMIQATIPAALGMAFTPWRLDRPLVIAGAATIGAVLFLFLSFRRGDVTGARLFWPALFYCAFAIALLSA
jgi:cation:H+ antiporter